MNNLKYRYLPTSFADNLTILQQIKKIIESIKAISTDYDDIFKMLDGKEDKTNLTLIRKLSETGDFTGTLAGLPIDELVSLLTTARNQLDVLAEHVGTGYSTNVVDAGYFTDSVIKRTYDGGQF